MGEKRATQVMRGLLLLYTRGLPNRGFLKGLVSELDGKERFFATVDAYFGRMQEEGLL